MKLVEARKGARYSQEQVAGHLGISRPTCAKMGNNSGIVTIEDAKKPPKLFDVDVGDTLFNENDN